MRMKNLVSSITLVLCLLASMLFTSCSKGGGDDQPSDDASSDVESFSVFDSSDAVTSDSVAEPDSKPFYSVEPIKDGKSEYIILFDPYSNDEKEFAQKLSDKLKQEYGVYIECKEADLLNNKSDKKINLEIFIYQKQH